MMIRKIACLLLLGLAGLSLRAQTGRESIEIDYGNPKTYVVGGVGVEGNQYFGENQVLQLTGLRPGMKLTVPGEDVTGVVKRLVAQRFFEDVAMVVDSLNVAQDTAWFKIVVKERPRVSRWTYSGVKSGERKDLQDRLNLRPGREFSDYVQRTSEDIIKRYYKEKGYLLCEVDTQVQKDTMIRSAIRVNFDVKKGNKVRIKDINFKGNNEDVSEYKLSKAMKETHSNKWYNFFKSKKFKEKEYQTDRKTTGNSVYPSEVLDEILQIKKGDIYDMVTMDKRLHGGGKQTDYDVRKLYMDNGYLFFNVTPVEVNIQNDSVDVEMRISEGKPAILNNIVINGNDHPGGGEHPERFRGCGDAHLRGQAGHPEQHRHQRQRPHEREGGPPPDHDPAGLPVQPVGFRAVHP